MAGRNKQWDFWIDRGGTFTDIVARRPDGEIVTHKLLSENPDNYQDAALAGMRHLLDIPVDAPLPAEHIRSVKMGTTVATNALLERKGDATLLVITRGFRDALRIGYQARPRLFDLDIRLPDMLYARVVEVAERKTAHGHVQQPLDVEAVRRDLEAAYQDGLRSVAIVLMHGYRYSNHEKRVARIAREIGYTQISTSHETSPLMKFVSRGETTVVDAYLSPILRRYVDRVAAALGNTRLLFMQSNGGLADAHFFQGKDAVLSGPAGGVVGMAATARKAGFNRVIGFDMGGTSTDVSHYSGEFERSLETEVAGVRLRAPMMLIHTVAAGGGSVLHFDGARYRVGPDSAGAYPGPACYRNGGPLTVTDCSVMLGHIQPDLFPQVFGPAGNQPIDVHVVRERFAALAERIREQTGDTRTPEQVAEGFLAVAVENMSRAIKQISVQRGYDVSNYLLNCFGGAGGQHACAVADALGMKRALLHPHAGVLSAYGIGVADMRLTRERAIESVLDESVMESLQGTLDALCKQGSDEMRAQGVADERIQCLRRLHLKYAGTNTTLDVEFADLRTMISRFQDAYRLRFGFAPKQKLVVIEAAQVEVIGLSDVDLAGKPATTGKMDDGGLPLKHVEAVFLGERTRTAVHARANLQCGACISGPAIISEANSTLVIEPGWQARVSEQDDLLLERVERRAHRNAAGTDVDPVMLEIFNNLFMSIAEQMGAVLEKTASSVNIKERRDFSCALFDAEGELIANAPHMPVHLGSMSESIKAVIRQYRGNIRFGDVFVLNAPYNGGTHLPDITVVKPVFERPDRSSDDNTNRILFYVATRGHHADIGGITPGSMPPFSRTVADEGVLLDNVRLFDAGRFRETAIRALLTGGRHPVRNVEQNIADLKAQVAACEKGMHELKRMVAQFTLPVVQAYMQHVQDNAEESVRRVLDVLEPGVFRYEMDDGSAVHVRIRVDREQRSATVDFTGTSLQHAGNFNAPAAVTRAAVLYVFRCLVRDDIPMNGGCLKPLNIVIPEGTMLNPRYPAAVVAGNVETSQVVVDALFGALGAVAAAQGTMNNFTFGNHEHQYYETLCGGSGAGPDFDGTDAVQTHMTNSYLTDPEVLEWRYPVLLKEFSIRENSGGTGRHRGGNGVSRQICFLEPMTASILSGHRRVPPFGVAGGGSGALGSNRVERSSGSIENLGGLAEVEMNAGDTFIIETPGGGGYGAPDN